MNVPVRYKPGQRRLLSAAKSSVLGDGLLERARSTSLALLGVTAAVGLAMVALALNQGWPLLAGVPLPGLGGGRQAVGDATIAAQASTPNGHGVALQGVAGPQRTNASDPGRKGARGSHGLGGPRAPGPEVVVVSRSTPVGPSGDSSPGGGSTGDAAPSPAPAVQQPTSTPAAEPTSSPSPSPSTPTPTSQTLTRESQPTAASPTASQPPPVSDEDSAHDHGHHFGRGGTRSYGHSHGRDDSEASEPPDETAEPAPSTPAASPPDSATPEEPESQPDPAPWSHGAVHGYGHDHGYDHGHW